MGRRSHKWLPTWSLKPDEVLDTQAALERLHYCLGSCLDVSRWWRREVWGKAAMDLLCPFEGFRGKRVLELGVGAGRMSCLLAAAGANATGFDVLPVDRARQEARRWGVESRVHFQTYDGDYRNLPPEQFDVVFTKSMMGFSDKRRLPELFVEIQQRLAPGGAGLFLENANNWLLDKVRRHITYRKSRWNIILFGLYPTHIEMMKRVFDSVQVRQYYGLIWAIRVGGTSA